jgi:hypothetical protein
MEGLVAAFFLTLLMFGQAFTKFHVFGPFYLHDLVLGVITLLALNNRRKLTLRFGPVVIFILLAFVYLIFSFIYYKPSGIALMLTFRQFNVIVYLLCCYLIFNSLVRSNDEVLKPVALIKFISRASVLLQVIFIVYGFMFIPGFGLFNEGEYNYFSPLVIFGVITYGAVALAYESSIWKRYGKFIFCILLSTTLGHSSAFLALFIILLVYFFIRITPLQRLLAVGIAITAILLLFLLPQFNDLNVGWRLLFWKHVAKRLLVDKYLIFGFGFGPAYMTNNFAIYLNIILHSPVMMDSYNATARYVTPPHNSLLTLAFHVGLIPSLLIYVPLKKYFGHLFFKPVSQDSTRNFLIYALTGCMIWICFNVILELPHAATYFWLVYFTTILYLKTTRQPSP